tara:strand:- start:378 stop:563 length:186 start_codon:yes stop_codon:yes gene_type:complete
MDKMIYEDQNTWTSKFIIWHIKFIKKSCDIEKHIKKGNKPNIDQKCLYCSKVKNWELIEIE